MILTLAVVLGCQGPDLAGRVDGRRWTLPAAGIDQTFPPAWEVTTEDLSSGLTGLVAEARSADEGIDVAVVLHPLPAGFGALGALDLLVSLSPTPDALQDPTYLLERVPACGDAVYRRRTGEDRRTVHQLAQRTPLGLLVWNAWQPEGRRGAGVRLVQVICTGAE